MIILEVLESVFPIVALIVLGYVLHGRKLIDDGLNKNLAFLVMNVALPASVFVSVIGNLNVSSMEEMASMILVGAAVFAVNYALSYVIMKLARVPKGRRGIFLNTIVNANTIFIGMPLNEMLFGDEAVKYFLVYYLLNTVSTWTIGTILISSDSSEAGAGKSGRISLKQIFSLPIDAFILAVIVIFIGWQMPTAVKGTLTYLGNLVTPLSLLYIGIVLSQAGLKSIHFDKDTVVALVGKFVLSPVIMVVGLMIAAGWGMTQPVAMKHTMIVQAAVPALTVLPILAAEAKGDVKYATNVVTTSTILFIVVIPFIMFLIA